MTYGVHLIAAVGLSGQIGLRGKVPWHGLEKYADVTRRDLDEFARLTEGGVLIIGSVTAGNMFRDTNFHPRGRVIIIAHRHDLQDPQSTLKGIRSKYPQRHIWICGGERAYAAFIPYVDWHHISVVPYDGAADAHMPAIIPVWQTYDPNEPGPEAYTTTRAR